MALVLPISGILAGVSVKKSGTYRIQLWLAWILMIVGSACFILLTQDSSRAESIGLTVIPTIGMGILFAGTYFPVLAPGMLITKNNYGRRAEIASSSTVTPWSSPFLLYVSSYVRLGKHTSELS
jgi:hypothetical protein